MSFDNQKAIWPISLAQIEKTVAAHLGPGRVPGSAAGPCLSRQVSTSADTQNRPSVDT